LIENYGGSHNGQTDKDHTIYFEQVPSNQLDMVLFSRPIACARRNHPGERDNQRGR
jgi:hypothetical protein